MYLWRQIDATMGRFQNRTSQQRGRGQKTLVSVSYLCYHAALTTMKMALVFEGAVFKIWWHL